MRVGFLFEPLHTALPVYQSTAGQDHSKHRFALLASDLRFGGNLENARRAIY